MMPKHSFQAPITRHLTAVLAVSLLTLGACADDGGGTGGSNVTVVNIATLPVNQVITNLIPATTRQMYAAPANSAGNWVDKPVVWASSNPAVGTISATGLFTALTGGTTYIRATAGGKTDSLAIGVRFPVGTINIVPANPVPTVRREGGVQLVATTLDTQAATVTGRTVTWTSSDPTVATVSATGNVVATATALDAATTTITATAANALDGGTIVTTTRLITILGDPEVAVIVVTGLNSDGFYGHNAADLQLTAVAQSALGNPIPSAVLTWGSSIPATATISGTGLIDFVAAGATNISVSTPNVPGGLITRTTTRALEVATGINAGANALATIASGTVRYHAVLATAADAFTLTTDAGTGGDVDMAMWVPGTLNTAFTSTAGATPAVGRVCNSGASGNAEACNITPAVSGWYRVGLLAWTGGGFTQAVTGVTLTYVP